MIRCCITALWRGINFMYMPACESVQERQSWKTDLGRRSQIRHGTVCLKSSSKLCCRQFCQRRNCVVSSKETKGLNQCKCNVNSQEAAHDSKARRMSRSQGDTSQHQNIDPVFSIADKRAQSFSLQTDISPSPVHASFQLKPYVIIIL